MTDELDEILAVPSREAWAAFIRMVDRERATLDAARIAELDARLSHWPSELRVAPATWCPELWSDGASVRPELALARCLDFVGGRRLEGLPSEPVPVLASIERVHVDGGDAGLLLATPALGAVRELALEKSPSPELLNAIGRLPLRVLSVPDLRAPQLSPVIADLPLRSLSIADRVYANQLRIPASLRSLDIGVGRGVLPALLDVPGLRLTTLQITTTVDEPDLLAVLASPAVAELERFGLPMAYFNNTEFEAFARAAFVPTLRSLHVGVTATETPPPLDLPALRELALHDRTLPAQLAAFLRSPLEKLSLIVDPRTAVALAKSPVTRTVRQLTLGGNPGKRGFAALAAAPWPALESLHLHRSFKPDAGLATWLAAGQLPALRRLVFERVRFVKTGLVDLVSALEVPLRELEIRDARHGDELAQRIAGNRGLARLERLVLRDVDATAVGAEHLADAGFEALRYLDLSYNKLGDPAVARIAAAPWFSRLWSLGLCDTGLGDAGAAQLATDRGEQLVTLALDRNQIGAAGAIALAAHPSVVYLTLHSNAVQLDQAAASELRASSRGQLAVLDLRGNALLDDVGETLYYNGLAGIARTY